MFLEVEKRNLLRVHFDNTDSSWPFAGLRAGSKVRQPGVLVRDFDKLALRAIQPVVKSLGLAWYGWHGFRRGIASNLYELGADEKIVQRILRHAKSHVTKDRYIKAFDPAVLAAMKRLEATLDVMSQSAPGVHRIN